MVILKNLSKYHSSQRLHFTSYFNARWSYIRFMGFIKIGVLLFTAQQAINVSCNDPYGKPNDRLRL